MFLSRRKTVQIIALMNLAGFTSCASLSADLAPSNIIAIANSATSGLLGGLDKIKQAKLNVIPQTIFAIVQKDAIAAHNVTDKLVTDISSPEAATILRQAVGYLNDVLNILAKPPVNGLIPAPFNEIFSALALVLPTLEGFINNYLPKSTGASIEIITVQTKWREIRPDITTTDQAIAILQKYSKP